MFRAVVCLPQSRLPHFFVRHHQVTHLSVPNFSYLLMIFTFLLFVVFVFFKELVYFSQLIFLQFYISCDLLFVVCFFGELSNLVCCSCRCSRCVRCCNVVCLITNLIYIVRTFLWLPF